MKLNEIMQMIIIFTQIIKILIIIYQNFKRK